MAGAEFLFAIAILIMSVVVHEFSHGYSAYLLGDPTAKYAGRLTLNPIKHLELFGSFLVPLMTYFAGGFILGWAKPVPYNPYNLKNQRWGSAIVGVAGPFANLFVAVFFGLFLRFGIGAGFLPYSFFQILSSIVFINIILAVFNLVPIPPLDGSKLLFAVLPASLSNMQEFLEKFGFFLVLAFIIFFPGAILPIIEFLFSSVVGTGF
ncbi:MAG: site-2 protease family protein [Candidatus Pacebacteria bacterium]|nr:site-2 protease family protein [Candidatus Paceibacterota bacterium]